MTVAFRRLSAVLLLGMAIALLGAPGAEACGSSCNMPEAPDCAGCQYTFFTRTRCNRTACHTCIEHDCWVSNPATAGERLATSELDDKARSCTSQPENASPAPKVVRVQILAARS